jgi:hypothetical protein
MALSFRLSEMVQPNEPKTDAAMSRAARSRVWVMRSVMGDVSIPASRANVCPTGVSKKAMVFCCSSHLAGSVMRRSSSSTGWSVGSGSSPTRPGMPGGQDLAHGNGRPAAPAVNQVAMMTTPPRLSTAEIGHPGAPWGDTAMAWADPTTIGGSS